MQENLVTVTFPSKCLVYPDIDLAENPDQIQIRTFKGKDEKLIAEISNDNFEKKFITVLRGVLKGIDPINLTIGDRLYLVVWQAINSYSKIFAVDYECEHCWQKSIYDVDLSALEIVELPEDFKEPYDLKLPISGDAVQVRLLRVADMLKINDMDKQGQSVWLYRYALTLVNDKSVWENVEYLENLSTKDLMVIRAFHSKFEHGVKMESGYECPRCGGTGFLPVPFRIELLLPYGKKLERYTGDSI